MMNQVGLNAKHKLLLSRKEQESWSSLGDRGKKVEFTYQVERGRIFFQVMYI